MTENIKFALDTIAAIGTAAFALGVLLVVVGLIAKFRTDVKAAAEAAIREKIVTAVGHDLDQPRTQIIDLMEALKESLKHKTTTGFHPEEPVEGPMIYPRQPRRASR